MRPAGWVAALICLLIAPAIFSCGNKGDHGNALDQFYPPDERGPYTAGVTTLYLVDQSRYERWGNRYRTLPLEIWYPSTGAGGHPNHISDMVGDLPTAAWSLLQTLYGSDLGEFWNRPTTALRDAEILMSSSPYPVVFFSHGFSGLRFQNYSLCEYLASHGFVVVAPDHYGNSIFVNLPGEQLIMFDPLSTVSTYSDRIKDVDFIFGELERMNNDGKSSWYQVFNLGRFAVSGHSYGGLTSIICGAEFDFVRVIAAMNPAWFGAFPHRLSKPFYMLQGENDSFVGSMNKATKEIWDEAASTRKVFIDVINGEHYSATDACNLIPPSLTFLTKGCEPPNIDFHLANQLSDAYMTAFFKSVLAGDSRYDAYLKENHFPEHIDLTTMWK